MTLSERNEFWLKFHRFQMRHELMFTPRINRELKAQVKAYTDSQDITQVTSAGMYEALNSIYRTTGVSWAYHTRYMMRTQKADGRMGFSERIIQLIQQYYQIDLLNTSQGITQTTIQLIQEVLTDAAANGWGIDEIVNRITVPGFTSTRARLIARTETMAAANAGSTLNAKSTGRPMNKVWISARDARTRWHHREVDNTSIPIGDKFNVGGYQMDAPGDKVAPASEVCNCRCCLAFVPMD